jgi:hypothetical protein
MSPVGFGAYPPRLSDAERERALHVLREGVAQGRVSQDTFERRADVVLRAQWEGELQSVLHDLPTRRPRGSRFVGAVVKASAWPGSLWRAWQAERLPELLLPSKGPYPLSIGRAPGSQLRLNDETVSRRHAQLRASGEGWALRDLGSSNGTWVNGSRVTGSVGVRPGDQVRFGQVGFRLTVPQPAPTPGSHPVREVPPKPVQPPGALLPLVAPKPSQRPGPPVSPGRSALPGPSGRSALPGPPEPSEPPEPPEPPAYPPRGS